MKKVNFWQVVGVVLVIVGAILFFRQKTGTNDTTTKGTPATPTTHPAP